MTVRLLLLLLVFCSTAFVTIDRVTADPPQPPREAAGNLKAFPKAERGMVRYVILLPEKPREEELNYRVELLVGKRMMTDGVNLVRMGGELEEKTAEGWGFTYYQITRFPEAASTLMAVPHNTPRVEKFVSIPTKLIRYNSRVPIVVYTPVGGEVRYRVWKAVEETLAAERG